MTRKPVSKPGLALAAFLMLAASSHGSLIIASWDTSNYPGDQASVPGVGSPNVTVGDMVRGPGLLPNVGSDSLNSRQWDGADAGDYVQFGLDVASGFSIILDELLITTRSSNTGPGTIGVYTSLDGFATPVAQLAQVGTSYLDSEIDLSGLGPVTAGFDVRLIEIGDLQADGDGATAAGGTFRVVNYDRSGATPVQVTGTLRADPVPDHGSTLALLVFGLVGAGVARKSFLRGK